MTSIYRVSTSSSIPVSSNRKMASCDDFSDLNSSSTSSLFTMFKEKTAISESVPPAFTLEQDEDLMDLSIDQSSKKCKLEQISSLFPTTQGKITLPNGDTYAGQLINGQRSGEGTLYAKNGECLYSGNWYNNKKEGWGNCYRPDGTLYYMGMFEANLPNGFGTFYYPDGKTIQYRGTLKKAVPHGNGVLYRPDGSIEYKGDFAQGKPHGTGIYFNLFINNATPQSFAEYEGEWMQGKFKSGNQYFSNGSVRYKGAWDSAFGQSIYLGFEHPDAPHTETPTTPDRKLVKPVAVKATSFEINIERAISTMICSENGSKMA